MKQSTTRTILRRVVLSVLAAGLALFVLLVVVVGVLGLPLIDHTHLRRDRTTLGIENLDSAMKIYRARKGEYPLPSTGFKALVDTQIIDKEPRDGWGNAYRYELVDGRPIITSLGSDGRPGGEGGAADISNRPTEVSAR